MPARGVGLLLGLSLAATAVAHSRIPAGTGTLGTDVLIATEPTGELTVDPSGPFVSATGLRPGAEADAPRCEVHIYNQSPVPLQVHVRGLPSRTDMDQLLWVSVVAGGRTLFHGPLGGLRSWTRQSYTLPSGRGTDVAVHTWIPASAGSGWAGRITTVDLQFDSVPVS